MIQSTPRPILARLTEVLAATTLGGAVGFAVAQGFGVIAAVGAAIVVAGAGWMLLARIDRAGADPADRFVPVDFPADGHGDEAEAQDDDVLLLDDPLPALDQQSRVVRLFAGDPVAAAATPPSIAGPGEMVARIADFLGSGRATGDGAARRGAAAAADDASAALHAALADIRRSLRHG